jgi:energy-coupling factor transporter transmembrane protein EcfT
LQINRLSAKIVLVLSFIALLAVLSGYTQPPQTDEGAAAHIFQLAILTAMILGGVFVATADWKRPLRSARPLSIPTIVLVLAFSALYYLERFWKG